MAGYENGPGTPEHLRLVSNHLRRYPRAVALQDADVTALEVLAEIREVLDIAEAATVMELRAQGYSWTQIGHYAGMTPSAARKKWLARPGLEDAPTARKVGGQPGHLR